MQISRAVAIPVGLIFLALAAAAFKCLIPGPNYAARIFSVKIATGGSQSGSQTTFTFPPNSWDSKCGSSDVSLTINNTTNVATLTHTALAGNYPYQDTAFLMRQPSGGKVTKSVVDLNWTDASPATVNPPSQTETLPQTVNVANIYDVVYTVVCDN